MANEFFSSVKPTLWNRISILWIHKSFGGRCLQRGIGDDCSELREDYMIYSRRHCRIAGPWNLYLGTSKRAVPCLVSCTSWAPKEAVHNPISRLTAEHRTAQPQRTAEHAVKLGWWCHAPAISGKRQKKNAVHCNYSSTGSAGLEKIRTSAISPNDRPALSPAEIQVPPEHGHGWRLHHLPGHPVSMPDHPNSEKNAQKSRLCS